MHQDRALGQAERGILDEAGIGEIFQRLKFRHRKPGLAQRGDMAAWWANITARSGEPVSTARSPPATLAPGRRVTALVNGKEGSRGAFWVLVLATRRQGETVTGAGVLDQESDRRPVVNGGLRVFLRGADCRPTRRRLIRGSYTLV